MAPRRTAALAIITLAAAGVGLTGLSTTTAQAVADSTPGYSLHHITVHTTIGPKNGQRCVVDADLYVPDSATRRHKQAAILTTNGFGGSKDDSNESAIGRGFVRRGYVVLAYTGLGFPSSGCKINLDDPQYDGKAGKQMVDVLAGSRSYVEGGAAKRLRLVSQNSPGDPRVGMIGGSYGGEIQYATAMQDKRVDALIPIITWNDLSYSLAPNNTSFARGVTYRARGVGKKEWVDLFFGEGILDGVEGASVDPTRVVGACPNFSDEACQAGARLNTVGYPDSGTLKLSRHASVSTYVRKIKAPTLLVQGQKDSLFNLQESVATFRALRKQHTPTRLIWQSWGHSSSTPAPGELNFDASSLRSSYLGNRYLNWMNHYVRGRKSAPVGSRFSYFRDWVSYDTSAAHAGTAIRQAYAVRHSLSVSPTTSLYLSGGSDLRIVRSRVQTGAAHYANAPGAPTSYSETSGLEGNEVNNPISDAPGTFAAFTTRALTRAANLVGSSRLTLHLKAPVAAQTQATPAGKLVLFAKIYDVAPDGTQTLHNRLISPVRVRDVTKPVTIELPGVVQRFKAGHRIRLVIAASDAAYAGNAAVQPVTIDTSRAAPSSLRMPLTSALRVK